MAFSWGWLKILAQIGPEILMFTPFAPIAPAVTASINLAEQLAAKDPSITGAQKKQIATQLSVATVNIINQVTGKTVMDSSAVSNEVGNAIDTVVGAINLVHKGVPAVVTP